jgi:lycopene beta-cyclase
MIKNKVSYISQIRTWLKSRHNLELDDYEVIESEHGVIPMGKIIPIDDSLARLGSAGYATKTSTGYTFEYILKQTKNIIDQIHQKQHLTTYNPHPKPLAALDYIFLKVVKDNPSLMPHIFMQMALKLKPDTFVEFMSEKNTFLTSFKMIMAMPKIPFITSLLRIGLKRNV